MHLPIRPPSLALAAATVLALSGLVATSPAYTDSDIGIPTFNTPVVSIDGSVVADTLYVVPAAGGTITSFSHADTPADAGTFLDFEVLRPMGGDVYEVVGAHRPTADGPRRGADLSREHPGHRRRDPRLLFLHLTPEHCAAQP